MKDAEQKQVTLEDITALTKRRGFIYQGSEIYGGLAGTWDYGPLGVALKNNIKQLWWKTFVDDRDDMYGLDSAILMNANVWKATQHTDTFTDPLHECTKCKKRFRGDHTDGKHCPDCKGDLGEERTFNMMFKTSIGAVENSASTIYLRPETAQGIFVNFKNVVDSFHPRLPFGIAQIGKAFRNEITARDFLFRSREFEQMEIEYFVHPNDLGECETAFKMWTEKLHEFISIVGIDVNKVHELDVAKKDLAHYSKRTIDFEFDFPFGRKELYGLAYRTDFDLTQHQKMSGVDLNYLDTQTGKKFIPHVIEPSLGLDRTVLALLVSAFTRDQLGNDERIYLKLPAIVAPIKMAVFPLLKNKPQLVEKAREVYKDLKNKFGAVMFDDNGNIGKRYRRQDEIGTPLCITVDFESLDDAHVTVRDRDTGGQERVAIDNLAEHVSLHTDGV